MKLEIIIEKNGSELWGRIENRPQFFPTTVADNVQGVLNNLKMLIKDYLKHEGKQDKNWNKIDVSKIEFEIRMIL